MRAIDHGDLTTNVANLDQALYVASCLSGASPDKTAHIYGTTNPEVVDAETGERYLIFYGDDVARHYLQAEQGWYLVYSITRGPA